MFTIPLWQLIVVCISACWNIVHLFFFQKLTPQIPFKARIRRTIVKFSLAYDRISTFSYRKQRPNNAEYARR